MTFNSLESKIQKLTEKRDRIEKREKILRQMEKKLKIKQLIEIGRVAAKAEIDHLDPTTLLGAFLEIKERSEEAGTKQTWVEKARVYSQPTEKKAVLIIVSFPSPLPDDTRRLLKQLKFHWNDYRKEWQGRAILDELKKVTQGMNAKIDVVSE